MPKKSLHQELFDEPYQFEFFQAVRLLEKIFPEQRAVGREATITPEIVRFRSRLGLDFPASEIHELKETNDPKLSEQHLEMFVNFMGMLGINGAMPTHYTELAMERRRYQDTTIWSFMDIFTHRSVSMFFRAWEKYRFPVAYERGNDDFTAFLLDFVGLGRVPAALQRVDRAKTAFGSCVGEHFERLFWRKSKNRTVFRSMVTIRRGKYYKAWTGEQFTRN